MCGIQLLLHTLEPGYDNAEWQYYSAINCKYIIMYIQQLIAYELAYKCM